MTRRERVIAALNHQEADFIPYQVDFTGEAYEKMAAFYNDKDFYGCIDNHITSANYGDDWGQRGLIMGPAFLRGYTRNLPRPNRYRVKCASDIPARDI